MNQKSQPETNGNGSKKFLGIPIEIFRTPAATLLMGLLVGFGGLAYAVHSGWILLGPAAGASASAASEATPCNCPATEAKVRALQDSDLKKTLEIEFLKISFTSIDQKLNTLIGRQQAAFKPGAQ